MKIKLYRNEPLVDMSVFCTWNKKRQDAWMETAIRRNRETFYISDHLYEFALLAIMAGLAFVLLLTGRLGAS